MRIESEGSFAKRRQSHQEDQGSPSPGVGFRAVARVSVAWGTGVWVSVAWGSVAWRCIWCRSMRLAHSVGLERAVLGAMSICDQEACGDKKAMRHGAACSQKQMVFDDGLFIRE